jgi:acetate kinase
MKTEGVMAVGKVERIGLDDAVLTHQAPGKPTLKETSSILEHTTAVRTVLNALSHPQHGVIKDPREIEGVGHRVVHGGEQFSDSVLIDGAVKEALKANIDLAPLHNPPNLVGIAAAEAILPGVPQVAVFDTAFHSTMPRKAFLYALPYVLYKRYRIRRYGFHGTSHKYVSNRVARLLAKPLDQLKIITCHLGNGASVAAVDGGRSVDTSMGFTPLEGLIMGTRSGDIDPSIISFVMAKEDLGLSEVSSLLNKHSGMLGISGFSGDMREIEEEMAAGDSKAKDAFDMFEYRLRKYVGAYAAAMNGVDVIIFTGGIGENSPKLRETVCENLTYLGVYVDQKVNANKEKEKEISSGDSKVKVFVIPTNEELVIARDTAEIVSKLKSK